MPSAPQPGRRPDPAARRRWQQRLPRFRGSGLSVADFCAREQVSEQLDYRISAPDNASGVKAPRLAPARGLAPCACHRLFTAPSTPVPPGRSRAARKASCACDREIRTQALTPAQMHRITWTRQRRPPRRMYMK
jgi:hypothetical protein